MAEVGLTGTLMTLSQDQVRGKGLRRSQASPQLLDCLLQALENLAMGIAIFTPTSGLVYANTSAKMLLSKRVWVEQVPLMSELPEEQLAWANAVHRASTKLTPSLVEFTHKEGHSFVDVVPVMAGTEVLALAKFGPHPTDTIQSLQQFGKHHHLTAAEIGILENVFRGMKPHAIASARDVALSTINSQLATIRHKTKCRSMAELLMRLTRLPAVLAARAA